MGLPVTVRHRADVPMNAEDHRAPPFVGGASNSEPALSSLVSRQPSVPVQGPPAGVWDRLVPRFVPRNGHIGFGPSYPLSWTQVAGGAPAGFEPAHPPPEAGHPRRRSLPARTQPTGHRSTTAPLSDPTRTPSHEPLHDERPDLIRLCRCAEVRSAARIALFDTARFPGAAPGRVRDGYGQADNSRGRYFHIRQLPPGLRWKERGS
jgi:hypothetical protein